MLSIIIPTKDRGDIFQQTLNALIEATIDRDIEIIIVNDSPENKVELQVEPKNNILMVQNKKSGAASGRNTGARKAKGEYILFLDDDIIVNRQNIEIALDFIGSNENSCLNLNWIYPDALKMNLTGYQFGRFLLKNNLTSMKGLNGNIKWNETEIFKSDHITSQFFLIKRVDFELIGGYDESLPFAGFEDYILSRKLNKNNINIYICPYSTILHNEADRTELQQWLERQKRGAITRRKAVHIGYKEVALNYPTFKKIYYTIISALTPVLFVLLKIIPNRKSLDSIYFTITNILLGTYIFKGYTSHQK